MEPEVIDTWAKEAEDMNQETLRCFKGKPPKVIEYIFDTKSFFFQEEVLSEWRRQERYDELIEYILYQHEEHGGEKLWQQVLLDLRQKKDEKISFRLLEGLYLGRAKIFWIKLKNAKKYPDNYLCVVDVSIAKGEVMKVLYEHAFILENKPKKDRDERRIEKVRSHIKDILNGYNQLRENAF